MEVKTTIKLTKDEAKEIICKHLGVKADNSEITIELFDNKSTFKPSDFFSLSNQMADKNVPQQNEI